MTTMTLYEGRGAELYHDVVSCDRSEVREILRSMNRGRDRVLELACGSGRLTLPLLGIADRVVAMDLSGDLLDILRNQAGDSERLDLHEGDVLAWEPEGKFDKVVMGTTSIALFDPGQRADLLRRIRRWLLPGGEVILTLRTPPDHATDSVEYEVAPGLKLREQFDRQRGTLTASLVETAGGQETEYSVTTFLLPKDALLSEMRRAGFELVSDIAIDGGRAASGIGDHRLLVAKAAPEKAKSFEFFLPPSRWEELDAVAAQGTDIVFADGTTAICAISGLWNASLGYGNVAVADAIHRANLEASALPIFRRGSRYATDAAERLIEFAGPARYSSVFYSTSGSAALDAVVKLSRQVQKYRLGDQRRRVVSLVGSYHGITSSAMALTGAYLYQDVYDVDERLHIKVPASDPSALEVVMRRFGPEIAAVVAEPVLGSGAIPLSPEVLSEIQRYRERFGFLLVADEVATGFYRTGLRFASEEWRDPDVMVVSKALTNGTCAASALLLAPSVLEVLQERDEIFWHGETQAGSPQSCAAIVATIDEFERLRIADRVPVMAARLEAELRALVGSSDRLRLTGRGAMWALHLLDAAGQPISTEQVMELVSSCRRHGVVTQPGPGCVQILPALTMPDEIIAEMVSRVGAALGEYMEAAHP